MKPAKIHRNGFDSVHDIKPAGRTQIAVCGTIVAENVWTLADDEYAWVPLERRCGRCDSPHANSTPRFIPSPIDLHLTTVEAFVLALARLGAEMEATPHAVRGCYFTAATGHAFELLPLCWRCRVPSWTDPRRWEWETARELVGSGEKYCYPHVCVGCRIGFRTERPRGADATCGTCRGQPDQLQRDELRYAAAAEAASTTRCSRR